MAQALFFLMNNSGLYMGLPKCNQHCGRPVRSKRSKFCPICFKRQAQVCGGRSSGNSVVGISKKRNGSLTSGNSSRVNKKRNGRLTSGNSFKGISKKRAGRLSSGNSLKGISKKRAGRLCSGNSITGIIKKRSGKRSGLKRCAKYALVVKKTWLDLILAGSKDWEIRGNSTTRRGWIHFAQSQAGGKLIGRAKITHCFEVPRSEFISNIHHHRVSTLATVPYKRIHAWVLSDAQRFVKPFNYVHQQGAVTWVKC